MKFQRLTICNFKNYRGKYTIDLSKNGSLKKNNIILIGGPNGSGKTTLVESLKLCLFGKRSNDLSNKKYQDYILDSRNNLALKEGDDSFFLQLDIEVDDSYRPYNISLRREWFIKNEKSIEEKFQIFRDGNSFEIIPSEYWEDYIISLIPPYISEYFFFDGERVKELAIGDKADEILRASIRDLIGLKSYETLYNDLETLKTRIMKKNAGISALTTQLEDKEKNIQYLGQELLNNSKLIEEMSSNIKGLKIKKYHIEEGLRRKAGAFAEERKKLEKNISYLHEKLNKINEDIKQISGDYLPFIMASGVCKNLLDQLVKERIKKELVASKDALYEINKDLIDRINNNENLNQSLNKSQLAIIIEEVNKLFNNSFNEVKDYSSVSLIHDLSLTESYKLEEFIKNIDRNIRDTFKNLLKQREDILQQLDKCNKSLNKIPNDDFIKEYIDKIASIESETKYLINEIESLKKKAPVIEANRNQLIRELEELRKTIIYVEEDNKKIQICINAQNAIKEFIDKATSFKIHDLEEKITFMYHLLANKEDMIKRISIDEDTFLTKLLSYSGELIKKESISAGEKEIYALSVLWGLSNISERKMPMIIDSPLAKLDSCHVNNIVDNFFTNAAEDVIILSHDREIDESVYKRLKPFINRSYRLSLDDSNKISEGYFFN